MVSVVPSQIVSFINNHNPDFPSSPISSVSHASAAILTTIVRLVDQLPTELLTISNDDYEDLLYGIESIRNAVAFWQHASTSGLVGLTKLNGKSPAILIRSALEKCPDQAPSPRTSALNFIPDNILRDSIRLDISSANSALHNGDWKAATVLAGAAAEALLLWSIPPNPNLTDVPKPPKGPPEDWHFPDYIKVALAIGKIKDETGQQATLAKDFRNLIHPGRAKRLNKACDRGTALTALAAVELIARDLG